jgi:peptidoglycan/LPS O-acetylase OafA/YrhL
VQPTRRAPLPEVTGMRFFLALWVVLLHMAAINPAFRGLMGRSPGWVANVMETGASAVGIFFLLSGFVLAYTYDLERSWRGGLRARFWMARLARVYPVFVFSLLLALPSLVAGLRKSGFDEGSVAGGMGATLLLMQAWIPKWALLWSGPTWSLSAEAFFYLCFPVVGVAVWRVKRMEMQVLLIAGLWVGICVVSYVIALEMVPPLLTNGLRTETVWEKVVLFNPLLRLPEFVAGILVCRVYLQLQERRTGWVRAGRGAVLYLPGMALWVLVAAQQRHIPPAVLHNGLLLPASAAVILGLGLGGGTVWRWLCRPEIVMLGQASYGMYLLHMPLYSYFAAGSKRLGGGAGVEWLLLLGYLATLLVLSWVTFVRLEEPSRRAILGRFKRLQGVGTGMEETKPALADPF